MKAVTHALALGLYLWVPTEGSSKRLFYCHYYVSRQSALANGLYGLNSRNTEPRCDPHPQVA